MRGRGGVRDSRIPYIRHGPVGPAIAWLIRGRGGRAGGGGSGIERDGGRAGPEEALGEAGGVVRVDDDGSGAGGVGKDARGCEAVECRRRRDGRADDPLEGEPRLVKAAGLAGRLRRARVWGVGGRQFEAEPGVGGEDPLVDRSRRHAEPWACGRRRLMVLYGIWWRLVWSWKD